MKQRILVKPHSHIDVITNSSSEIFIMKTDKTVEAVKEVLQSLLDTHKLASGFDRPFDDVFGDIYLIETEEQAKAYEWEVSFYKYWDHFSDFPYGSPEYDAEIDKVIEKNHKYHIGSIVIESAGDNSIPWFIQQAIEELFGADRTHLG